MDDAKDLTFPRKPGTGSVMGIRFEIKMILLLFLRVLNMKVTFKLSTSDKRCGLFDDIVLRYNNGEEENVILIQLKHKDPNSEDKVITDQALATSTGTFSLNKYFNSYCELQDTLHKLEHVHYILYTNRQYQTSAKFSKDIPRDLKQILNTGGDDSHVSHFNILNHQGLCEHLKNHPQASNFLERFRFFSGQANEDQLDQLIKQEISRYFNRPGTEGNKIFTDMYRQIEIWYHESSSEMYYLTENWSTLKTIEESLEDQGKLISHVTFMLTEVEVLASKLFDSDSNIIFIYYTDGSGADLYSLKILQAIKLKDYLHKVYISSLSEPTENLDKMLSLWENGHFDTLVLYSSEELTNSDHMVSELVRILNLSSTKKLVLISAESQHHYLKEIKEESWKIYEDTCEFKQLCSETQDLIWDLKSTFQGVEETLKEIDKNRILTNILQGKVLSQFLNIENSIKIGKPLNIYNNVYVSRTLKRDIEILRDLFTAREISDIFIVSGIGKDELRELVRCNNLVGEYSNGKVSAQYNVVSPGTSKICMNQDTLQKPVHYLLKNGPESFLWIESLGERDNIFPYIKTSIIDTGGIHQLMLKCKMCHVQEKDILISHMKVVFVTGEPGVGKTELLTYMESEAKKMHPNTWVVKVNLSDIVIDLQRTASGSVTHDFVINVLKNVAIMPNSECPEVADALLMEAIDHAGNIIILLDASDESVSNSAEIVIATVKIILEKKVSSIWVSHRNIDQDILNKEFETRSFILKPLTDQQQIELLVSLWGRLSINSQDLPEIAKRFLLQIQNLCSSENRNPVSSIPLFLRMLADIYPGGELNNLKVLNLADIYDMFINKKFEILFKDLGMDIAVPRVFSVTSHYQRGLMKRYALYAAKEIGFTNNMNDTKKAKVEEKINQFIEEMKGGDKGIEMLASSVNDYPPRFIHYSFLEYFAALWLITNKENNLNLIKEVQKNSKFKFLRGMFDRTLCRPLPLHLAVLDNDQCKLKLVLKAEDVNVKDGLGRTALNLAVYNSHINDTAVMEQLLNSNADTEVHDKLFYSTPIYQAAEFQAWSKVKLLLQKGAKVYDNIAKEIEIQDLLKVAIKNNYCQDDPISQNAFEINWKIFDRKNEINRDSILHLAIRCKNLECVKMLLKKGAHTDIHNNRGVTPLVESVLTNNTDIVELILKKRTTCSYNPLLLTPLYYACCFGLKEIVQLLLRWGESPNTYPMHGITALHGACDSSNYCEFIVTEEGENASNFTLVFQPNQRKPNSDIVRKLLEHKADINARNIYGCTPLMIAVHCQSRNIVKLLIDKYADVNIPSMENLSPLAVATMKGDHTTVQLLLDNNADISPVDVFGRTPLHHATKSGHTSVIKLLLEKRADVTVKDLQGRTPLHDAALTIIPNALKNFKLLNHFKADVTVKDKFNMTPLHAAWFVGNKTIVDYMLKEHPSTVQDMLKSIASLRIGGDNISLELEKYTENLKERLQKMLPNQAI